MSARATTPASSSPTKRESGTGHAVRDWRLCPHGDEHGCPCRNPRPGTFLDLAHVWEVDLARSVHVGDSDKDGKAARAAGIGTFVPAVRFFGW